MLCYWGAQVREGFGLIQEDKVKHLNDAVRCVCLKSEIQDMSAGRCFVGFIRNGKASVLELRRESNAHIGKLKQLELENEEITSIVCGGGGAVLLSRGGKVIIMDKSTVCSPLKNLANMHVIQISCGDQHSMALTQDGRVYVWGENAHGQLGLNEGSGCLTPQHMTFLDGVPLAQISAGGDHSFVLSLSGVVFGWGKNSSGQLGLGDTTDRRVPTVIKSLNGKKTQFISCGGEHTATLSKGGTVFTFGSGKFGQLGHNSFKDEHLPRVVAELWASKVSQVTCGRHHTLVLVASSQLIYSFGCGTQGELGNGQLINQSVPSLVDLTTELNDEYGMGKLFAGENHSFALFVKELETSSGNPEPNPNRKILTLDDTLIDHWVSKSDSKSWMTTENQINKVFSSAASLNGSFLKRSCDEHYRTSVELCGLDFHLVKKSFAKISGNKRVMSKVMKMVRVALLPSLNSSPSSVEALRVYLLLPEVIAICQDEQQAELLQMLASKILQLKPDALKVLENYWSKLPAECLKGLVKLFQCKSAEVIGEISSGEIDQDELKRLQKFLQVLQMLYKVCCSAQNDTLNRDFIIPEISDVLDTMQLIHQTIGFCRFGFGFVLEELLDQEDHYLRPIETLSLFPCVADIVSKQRIFTFLQNHMKRSLDPLFSFPCNNLHVNRDTVLKDTLRYLRQGRYLFHQSLEVTFAGENGIDAGGLSAEFFSLVSDGFLKWEKKLLDVFESSLVWFNSKHTHHEDFHSLGVIYGIALFNHRYMNINFPLALFKKLLDQSVTLNDLEEISPTEARSLKDLLEEDEEVVEIQFLDFTVKGQELLPNGAQIPVTKINRQKYVDLYVDFMLNKSVKNQFEKFAEGFSKGCPVSAWRIFHPEELRLLLHGSPVYEWEDLLKCATYTNCSPSDELIKNFWTVFFELSEEDKRKFLVFMYGTDRVPAGGLSKLTLKIVLLNVPDSDDRLPEAKTCFGTLHLPKYSNIDILRNQLIHAVSFCKVFGRAWFHSSDVKMLCYWGAQVREGFGLIQEDKVKHVNDAVRCVCLKSEIQDMSAGRCFVGFIRDGNASVLKFRDEPNGHDGKLKTLTLKNDKIRSMVCGGSGAVLLGQEGKVFVINKSTLCIPLKDLTNRHVIQISCGDQHSMALTQDGRVYVWGENSHGQLGLNEGSGCLTPQHMTFLDGVPLAQISAGGDHSFVLSLSGVVFGWGKNSSGQLGLGDTTDRHVPTLVKSLNGKKTQFISCGGEHTATLSKGGTVFTFGSGKFGQLGHNSFKDEHLPRVVAELWASKVSQVTCGRHHTLVLVASSQLIYSFGCGTQGELGNGQMINQSVPSPVHLTTDSYDEYVLKKVIAGEHHSFALFSKVSENESTNPKPNQSRQITTLNERMIDQWVSDSWKVVKNKIKKMFSSAASLNGSFLKTSCDEHYQTSEEFCGLDFDLVKKSFAKLSNSEGMMSKVVNTVQVELFPSLNSSPSSVEALRVYLLLPELIAVCQDEQRTKLLQVFASAILQLKPDALKVLENYWSKLPGDCLKNLVKLFRKESVKLIGRIGIDKINWDVPSHLEKLVKILQMVYKACCSAQNKITRSDFIIQEVNDLLDMLQTTSEDLNNNWWLHNFNGNVVALNELKMYYVEIVNKLKVSPCIFNLEAKCRLWKNRLFTVSESLELQVTFTLTLRRTALLDDCFNQLKIATDQQLKGWLSVYYAEDLTYKSEVNKRDFFINVFKELREPDSQFFIYNDDKTMMWFPTKPSVQKEKYFLFGILCGLALNNSCVVHLPFPLALFKKLFNVKPSLEDLTEFDPVLGRSLEYALDYSDNVKEMKMHYTIQWDKTVVELDPTNPGKPVTNYNRTDFVDKYVDYVFNKSVEETFEEFRRGFFKGCDRSSVEMLEPKELREVLLGNEDYDWDLLKQNATYEGLFYAQHTTIISFWEVFEELTSNQKKAFLLFLTGFERVPILGMSQVKMRVRDLFNSTQEHLPQALTCHSLLELPVYQSKATLKEKLIEALNHRRGFWEE
nr:probable E3 ubiquitin-protein ligase HERC4 [Misgurnus anguillicaudatus]